MTCPVTDTPKYPLAVKQHWQKHLDAYLQHRESLRGIVLVMDIRHPLKEFDQMMVDWCESTGMPLHILLTKADKLKRGPAQSTLLRLRKTLVERLGEQGFGADLFRTEEAGGRPAQATPGHLVAGRRNGKRHPHALNTLARRGQKKNPGAAKGKGNGARGQRFVMTARSPAVACRFFLRHSKQWRPQLF